MRAENLVDIYELSPLQQGLLFHSLYAPDSGVYIEQLTITLSGDIDVPAFKWAWEQTMGRHAVLRTAFYWEGIDKPHQVVYREVELPWEQHDWRNLTDGEHTERMRDFLVADRARGFDFSQPPMMRFALMQLADKVYRLVWCFHHVILDGWSTGVVLKDVSAFYKARTQGTEPELVEERPYSDYISWIKQQDLSAAENFWRSTLKGFARPTRLNLGRGNAATVESTPEAAHHLDETADAEYYLRQLYTFPADTTAAIFAFARQHQLTVNTLVQAAWALLLSRYSGEQDVVFGVTSSGRPPEIKGVEQMVGLFVNTLPMRLILDGTVPVREWLQAVQQQQFQTRQFEYSPLVEVQGWSEVPRGEHLFESLLAYQNYPIRLDSSLFSLDGRLEASDIGALEMVSFPLCFLVIPGEQMMVRTYHDLRQLDVATVTRMAAHFEVLLKKIIAHPDGSVNDLSILTEAEEQQIVIDWNRTNADYPRGKTIPELFAAQVERVPDALAVSCGGVQLTYRDLNQKANQLAHYLQSLGVKPEVLVGVCVERSVDLVVALLAVLKAGAAYVALDPSYPSDRLAFMLADAGATVLITQTELLPKLSDSMAVKVCIDRDWAAIEKESAEPLVTGAEAANLAYVIYTSGSTGKPKGVMVEHRSLHNLCSWHQHAYQLTASDRATQVASLAFDASVWELWPYLTAGASIHIPDEETRVSAPQLLNWLAKERITISFLPTPLAEAVLQQPFPAGLALRALLTGGDRLHAIGRVDLPFQLINHYGPTENTVVATACLVDPSAKEAPPIGRPITNTRVYVLDQQLQPVPVGVAGELYIGGDSLARGYLMRPELTGEKFIADPFSRVPGDRLYKTGDVVRYLPDGDIEFLGRKDEQVKLRGNRIELGEIEEVLLQHPAVSKSVVTLREDTAGDKRIVAYVVADTATATEDTNAESKSAQVDEWQMFYDDLYGQSDQQVDQTLNLIGWNSTYNGEPLPEQEMHDWLQDTVDRIISLDPGRVLEIGCGTGLLLFPVAPHASRYLGVDFSGVVLGKLRHKLREEGERLAHVELAQREADDFTGIRPGSFDTIVLNSVVQYFPDIDYLVKVLENAVAALAPGGRIFLGDIRSYPLLETFHAAVQLFQADDSTGLAELYSRVQKEVARESELTIDPAFFTALQQHLPQLTSVEILPKRGGARNELTEFRYQVVLSVAGQADAGSKLNWSDWKSAGLTIPALRQLLATEQPEALGFTNVTNSRVVHDLALLQRLRSANGSGTVSELRQLMLSPLSPAAVNPDQLWELGRDLPYEVRVSWGQQSGEAGFDVLMLRRNEPSPASDFVYGGFAQAQFKKTNLISSNGSWSHYANKPLRAKLSRQLGPELREYLAELLPGYMVPAAFVTMADFPLTPNGKVDRKLLPAPDEARPELGTSYRAPETPVEEVLAGIWSHVLGVEKVGIEDDFFELGGHSLLATQVVSRIRESFQAELPLRALFDSPTIAQLAEHLERGFKTQTVASLPAIERRERQNAPRLSWAQQRLWLLDQLDPASTVYNSLLPIQFEGALDLQALERSLNEIVRRHESLRTSFPVVNGEPIQLISPSLEISVPVMDLTNEDEEALPGIAATFSQERFDLANGPLLRTQLIKLSDERHMLLVAQHHAITDGWSIGLFMRELAALYKAYLNGAPSPLPELSLQYADYSEWQHQHLQGEVLDRQLEYWRDHLAGATAVLELPTDHPRPAVETFHGKTQQVLISAEVTEHLKQLSREEGSTLFMTLLAAFQVLLAKYTAQTDIIIGSPIANRHREEIESLLGLFINTLVLRTDLSGDPNFSELLGRVREVTLGAYAHQDVPFERLVEALHPVRDLSRNPLFQVMFILQNAPAQCFESNGQCVTMIDLESGVSKFDLTLALLETERGLEGSVEYNSDLFEPETIARLMVHYQTLLATIVSDPEQSLSALSVITEEERQQLLVEWNETAREFDGVAVAPLFEEQVVKNPDAIAVSYAGRKLSYRELNERANQLARHLLGLGVGREELVGVMLERSEEMLVALLAVQKAGAAYVPLDPAYPAERVRYMLQDAGVRVLVTDASLAEKVGAEQSLAVVRVDAERASIEAESHENVNVGASGKDLAYVIYTSGSTGKAKGVEIEQGALVNFLRSMQNEPGLTAQDRLLAVTTLSFDIAGLELYLPLLVGGNVEIASRAEASDGERLAALLESSGATAMQATPATWRMLIESGWRGDARLKMLCGGEALSAELAAELLARGRELWNLYGPTETTIWSSVERVTESNGVSIGRPIANTQCYILDEQCQPVPVGVRGELYIGGAGVARGYHGRAELTAERFVANPFGAGRLYRTGDAARYLSDGRIECLGRLDQQVKVRGFRIEPGEVESVLNSHPEVRECVVLARPDAQGEQQLVGYVVGGEVSDGELRQHLKQQLPEYMVPSLFVRLESLPLTPNGKVDRKALPAPDAVGRVKRDGEFVAPRTPTEERLAKIWGDVLGLNQVSVRDNFFDLGGHSLLATKVISRIRDVFNTELPLRSVFETTDLAELARSISSEKVETSPEIKPIQRVSRDLPLPLSFAQQRLWFLDQLEPGSATYNLPVFLRLRGPLEISALTSSLDYIVSRHESLRTTFAVVNDEPRQFIAETTASLLQIIDLRSHQDVEQKVLQFSKDEALTPFDLAHGPLLRAKLFRLADEEAVLLLTFHHIVADGWSGGVLIKELSALYEGFITGRAPDMAPLRVQYADYAVWQREWLTGDSLHEQLAYWQNRLAGVQPLELPTDRPRPAAQTYAGSSERIQISPEATGQLRQLGEHEGATLFMVLLTAFKVLLSRYSHQQDIAVGTPVAGRDRMETEDLIGLFVNTLVLRTDLSGAPTFRELLERVRETCLSAYGHQQVPFERLVEELAPERDLSRSPLFQVMFVLQHAPNQELRLKDLDLRVVETESQVARFDLTLTLGETAAGLQGVLEYNTDLFDRASIERLLQHFEVLLGAIASNPDQSIVSLPLLSARQSQQLLIDWNDTTVEYELGECLHERFEAQVRRTPHAVALVFADQSLTYAELDERANQLAHYLQERGVGPEVLVGVLAERSLEMVVALLGILKAGGAYVPLDPGYPAERLQFMLADARVRVLLTQAHLVNSLPVSDAELVCLDSGWTQIARRSVERVTSGVTPENLAYVIYTSGSTGKPKGAMNTHRAICNRLLWMQDQYHVDETDRVLQKTPFSFDVSVWEFFWPLITGARLIMALPGGHQDSRYLVDLIGQQAITTLHFVPSMLQLFLQEDGIGQCTSLRRVICSGEALSYDLQQKFFARLPVELHNLYGPTEAAVDVTSWTCRRDDERRIVPIGRPISNIQIYILDEQLQPVPVGVSGELHIGGVGLARGYFDRPHLTAEKFISSPFSNAGEARLYKTGDLARYLPDGAIEYLGRIDHQVKLRGFRIELGEIETALAGHGSVAEAIVIALEDHRGDKTLVAYVVPTLGAGVDVPTLRNHLKQRLPEYMVPSAFMALESLPLSPNGKIDRKALPTPDNSRSEMSRPYVAPRNPIEEILSGIWREVLRGELIGTADNFFESGGHSLLATQLVSRIRTVFRVELPVRAIFEEPTIQGLAQRIEGSLETELDETGAIEPVTRERLLKLSFAQQRLWFLDQLEPDSSRYNLVGAVRLNGELNVAALKGSLNEIVRRHESLRTTFATIAGDPVQVIHQYRELELPVIDLSDVEIPGYVNDEARLPFDLEHGPLFRLTLLRVKPDEQILLFAMHHIVSDGWSLGVLLRELVAFYKSYCDNVPADVAELQIQYADFAHWQRSWLQGKVLDTQLAYWCQKLQAPLPVLDLPTDYPRPAVQTTNGAHRRVLLPRALAESVKQFSQQRGVTVYMTLLAAFKTLLSRYSGQDDIIVGSAVAGRNRAETESLIGYFVNTVAMRTDLSGNPAFADVLQRVREVALAAYSHQDLPFERLVYELKLERDLSRTPLFQVMFDLQNAPPEPLKLQGLSLSPVEFELDSAKFDLSWMMVEQPDGFLCHLEYNTDLFAAATIDRMLNHFQQLLTGAINNPATPIAELPLLTEAEQQTMLVEWNQTACDFEQGGCVHEMFEAQAQLHPQALAVATDSRQLTYGELNERANQLAHRLLESGVKPNTLVAVMLERCVDLVVSLLAVLKSGAAYVPLDPEYPSDRLAFMLADAGAQVVLTEESLADRVQDAQVEIICLDRDWQEISQHSSDNPNVPVSPKDLAYTIYTSGSTGIPKGVEIEHAGLLNLVGWHQRNYQVSGSDRATLVASPSFDASVWELWPYLTASASVHIPSDNVRMSPPKLWQWLIAKDITISFLPTPLAEAMLAEEIPSSMSLRVLLTGGDRLHPVKRSVLPFKLVNHYGPTENTVVATYGEVDPLTQSESAPPIGRPISNTQAYLLNDRLQPVPIGVAGEIFIGGASLARGYHKRAALTNEKFIPHPFSQEHGARLYRTGDLGRYLPDGQIEFLTRTDHQVKIRGFRIELGEIEAVLGQHPAVRENAVLAREDVPTERRLVAYVVARSEIAPTSVELRSYLAEKLPPHMLPAAFVMLAELPQTANGKLDRNALPAPEQTRSELTANYVAPRTAAEEKLVEIWAHVLKLEQIGVNDNFFELGGDSILSIQIVARANQAGLKFTPKQLFQNQTIAQLASVAVAATNEGDREVVTGSVPLTPIQHWFFEQNLAESHHFNQASLLEVPQTLDPALLEKALGQLVNHHDALRLRFKPSDSGWQQEHAAPEESAPFSQIDLSQLSDAEQQAAFERSADELQSSLDLTSGPILRAALFNFGANKPSRLLIVIHHLAVDGVSWRILFEDLESAYSQLSTGETVVMPPKSTSYKRWAEQLTAYAQSPALQTEARYWVAATNNSCPALPIDHQLGDNAVASTASITVALDFEETRGLLQDVPGVYHTQINDVLLTALSEALRKWTSATSLLVDLEGHGREEILEDIDLSRTVGWFTTITPVVLQIAPSFQPGTALTSIKEQLRRIPNRGIGYGILRYLGTDGPRAKLENAAEPEISFNYLGQIESVAPSFGFFGAANDFSGSLYSPKGGRRHLIDVLGNVVDRQLRLAFTYSVNFHRAETIQQLADDFLAALRAIIEHCQSTEAGGFTASDFLAARMSQEDFNSLLTKINKSADTQN